MISLTRILDLIHGEFENSGDSGINAETLKVGKIAPLGESGSEDLAFFFSKEYQNELPKAGASVLVVGKPFVDPIQASGLPVWKKTAIVSAADPYFAMAVLSAEFRQEREFKAGTERSSWISEKAEVASDAELGPNVVVEDGAKIGSRTRIGAGSTIGAGVEIGEDCQIFPNVSIYSHTVIKNRVRIHSGTVVGADGFGYAPKLENRLPTMHQKIWHTGGVLIEDDVEIGANTCVDRATFGLTTLGKGSKIDNLVQIGHNVTLAEGVVVCGGTALAGGVSIDRFSYIGGITGVTNRVKIGKYCQVGADALITKDMADFEKALGNPQRSYRDHFRAHAALNKFAKVKRT